MTTCARFAEDLLAASGARQHVVVSAGLDTYAYRHPEGRVRVLSLSEAVDLARSAGFAREQPTTPGDKLPAALWRRTDRLRPGTMSGLLRAST